MGFGGGASDEVVGGTVTEDDGGTVAEVVRVAELAVFIGRGEPATDVNALCG